MNSLEIVFFISKEKDKYHFTVTESNACNLYTLMKSICGYVSNGT